MKSFRALFLFEIFISLFIVLLFLSINADNLSLVPVRIGAGAFLVFCALFLPGLRSGLRSSPPFPFYFFLAFLGFQALKFSWALFHEKILSPSDHSWALYEKYLTGPGIWLFYFSVFWTAFSFFYQKGRIERLLKVLLFSAVFLSLNAIPPLLTRNYYGYGEADQGVRFFHPFFYQKEWLYHYLFGLWSNMNWAGDFLAFGVFAGMGLGFYDFYRIFEKKEPVNPGLPLFWFTLAMLNAIGLLLLKSRGSLSFFAAVFIFYLAALLMKMRFRHKAVLATGFAVVFLGFVLWAGNLPGAVKEIQTLSEEFHSETRRSFEVNVEGGRRALRMFRAYPWFGIGKGNYENASDDFAEEGQEKFTARVATYSCECHYLTLLAEEGAGGLLYFLFLASFIFYALKKSLRVPSRFQFLAGWSLLAPVLLVLGHAGINDVMDRFSMPALVYVAMGAFLGLFRADFQRR